MKKILISTILCITLLLTSFQSLPASAQPAAQKPISYTPEISYETLPPEILEHLEEREKPEAELPTPLDVDLASEDDDGIRHPMRTRDGKELREDGLWYVTKDLVSDQTTHDISSIQTIFGPDQYGYTWEDNYTYEWIDVSGGIDTGINNNITSAGPISIGFDFNFYTNTYSQIYITRYGYLSFNDVDLENSQSHIPDPELPNDVIAPMWGPSDSIGYVKYMQVGESPDKQMIIEWNQQSNDSGTEINTFQVILHENGDIVFQYKELLSDGRRYCTSSGIEDSEGIDGLTIKDLCEWFNSGDAVRIYRPEPSARLSLFPVKQGGFVSDLDFSITIRNLGDFGDDTYDLQIESTWSANLYKSDGITLLSDTDEDGVIDSGSLPVGGSIEILVRINPPPGATTGDSNITIITALSSLEITIAKESTISLAYPAPFAQAFSDDDAGAGIYLVNPSLQIESLPEFWPNSLGIVETANRNIVFIDDGQIYDPAYETRLTQMQTTIFNGYGDIISPATYLSNLTPSENEVWEFDPALAAAPNGNVGLLWYRSTSHRDFPDDYVENMIFAIIDESGELVYAPTDITENSLMGDYLDEDIPFYSRPQLAVAEDGKYAIAFSQRIIESGVTYNDIFFSIRNQDGSEFTPLTNITRAATTSNTHNSPSITALTGNRFLLVWETNVLMYAVIDSAGTVLQSITPMGISLSGIDMVQLSDGNIFIAGSKYMGDANFEIHFMILDGNNYNILTPLTALLNPNSNGNNDAVSVTRDKNGHAILTWGDYGENYLYYALVRSDGGVVTEPFIYRSMSDFFFIISETGYGNTTYSTEFPPFTDCENVTTIPESECLALLALYEGTNGDEWTDNTNWLKLGEPGTWFGVTVSGNHVTELELPYNNLTGEIPAQLGNLSGLTYLSLEENQLSGPIPSQFGNLINLAYLYLYDNQLSGSIPTELGNLTGLISLRLGYNQLTGTIPAELGNLPNLLYLYLNNNQLSGSIPPQLGNLSNLRYLWFASNELTGSIPTELGYLTNVRYLNLWGNLLTGSIPQQLGSLTNLWYLYLSNNQLTGSIPTELGNLTNLLSLGLWANELTGEIPPELGSLINLTDLDLDENQLTGSIPSGLGNLTNLTYLNLDDNQLTGNIPPELGNLTNLQALYLGGNLITGSIPPELGSLNNLLELGLGSNGLTGNIPSELGNLTNLLFLSLYNNLLTGSIPSELGSLTNLQSLYLHRNQLSSSIPPELGNLSNLEYLILSRNGLTGNIPSQLGSLTNLYYLEIYQNQLTGTIPAELGNLSNLGILDLGDNQLSGTIPMQLGSLTNLWLLSFAQNLLTGSIPPGLGNLNKLEILDLSKNELSGNIPTELGSLSSLFYLSFLHNQLTGNIPSELGNLSNLEILILGDNELTDAIPTELGDLSKLSILNLNNNTLSGDVPATITKLINLCEPDDPDYPCYSTYGLDLGYNHLNVPAPEPPASFLATKDPDWYLTQALEEVISADTGGTLISSDGNTEIEIPDGALTTDTTFLFDPQPSPSNDTGSLDFAGNSFELTAWDGETAVTTFAAPFVITIHYDEADLGYIPEDSLMMFYWDVNTTEWVDAATTCPGEYTRNLDDNWLSLPVCHLTEFALLGEPLEAAFDIFLPMITR